MIAVLLLALVGLVVLIAGAELMVRGASRLALLLGVSPLVVGLTIVSMGTGSPEIAIGVRSALSGSTDLAVGNVIGSNIFNVLGVLGISALFAPLVVSRQLIRSDVPIMIGISGAMLVMSADGFVDAREGFLLLACLIGYSALLFRQPGAGNLARTDVDTLQRGPDAWLRHIAFVLVGLLLLIVGSNWLVDGAVAVATALGVSEVVIGLTIVAVGTSLPELVTSAIAAIRGEREIAVGNAIGSNIFNILGVLGITAAIAPNGLPVSGNVRAFDMPVMLAAAVACLPVFFNGYRIARWEGALFLAYYAAYVLFVVLTATQNPNAPVFGQFMLVFVIPLTTITLLVVSYRFHAAQQRGG